MSCLRPLKIPNPRYKGMDATSVGDYSERVYGVRYPPNKFITIPCGKCIFCQKRKFSGYRMRLLYELNRYPNSIFVTFTFDESNLSRFKDDPNKAIKLFLDRVRKSKGKQVRHWFVAEYGKKRGRLHYHGILFNCIMDNEELQTFWKYGNTFVGYANEVTARYIVKYLTKDDTKGSKPPRVVSSKGIGENWLNTDDCKLAKAQLSTAIIVNGLPMPLPRYYIDKMYTDREKEIISYYNLMESVSEFWLNGKKYTDEMSYIHDRKRLYFQYKSLGLIASTENYDKCSFRISNDIRYSTYLDEYFNLLLNDNLI